MSIAHHPITDRHDVFCCELDVTVGYLMPVDQDDLYSTDRSNTSSSPAGARHRLLVEPDRRLVSGRIGGMSLLLVWTLLIIPRLWMSSDA
jgi:hypothetical protein